MAYSLVWGQSPSLKEHHRHSFLRHFRKCGLLLLTAHRNQTGISLFSHLILFFFSVFGSCSDRMFDGDVTEEEEELKKMLSAHSKREPRYIRYL